MPASSGSEIRPSPSTSARRRSFDATLPIVSPTSSAARTRTAWALDASLVVAPSPSASSVTIDRARLVKRVLASSTDSVPEPQTLYARKARLIVRRFSEAPPARTCAPSSSPASKARVVAARAARASSASAGGATDWTGEAAVPALPSSWGSAKAAPGWRRRLVNREIWKHCPDLQRKERIRAPSRVTVCLRRRRNLLGSGCDITSAAGSPAESLATTLKKSWFSSPERSRALVPRRLLKLCSHLGIFCVPDFEFWSFRGLSTHSMQTIHLNRPPMPII